MQGMGGVGTAHVVSRYVQAKLKHWTKVIIYLRLVRFDFVLWNQEAGQIRSRIWVAFIVYTFR